jgi:hypothetical protein
MPPDRDDLMGGTRIDVHHQRIELPHHVVVTDVHGNRHKSDNVNVDVTDDQCISSYSFDLPADQYQKAEFQIREFDKFVHAKNITLSPDSPTSPEITVTDAPSPR